MQHEQTSGSVASLKAGLYKENYVIYARRSEDDPDSQKNSVRFQREEAQREALRKGLRLARITIPGFCTQGIVSEHHSAFKESVELDFGRDGEVTYRVERPKFHRLMRYLSKRYFRGVIVLCWDRISRNKADEVIIRKLIGAGVDLRFVRGQYEPGSAGELHMDMDGMFAAHHSRVTREKVSDTIKDKRDAGYCTHQASVGYLNPGTMEQKPFDPERAPIITRLFELADTTDWSLSDLHRWAIEHGLTMRARRSKRTREEKHVDEESDLPSPREQICRPPTRTSIHNILTSPFYTGKVRGNGGRWVASRSHQALVSDDRFTRVQAKLAGRRTSIRYAEKLERPFRGLVRCACGRVFTPYEQKGAIYYGVRCAPGCENHRKSVNERLVDATFCDLLKSLSLSDDEVQWLDASLSAKAATAEAKRIAGAADRERQAKKVSEDLAYVQDNKLLLLRSGVYTAEALADEETRLRARIAELDEAEPVSAAEIDALRAAEMKLSELVKNAADTYLYSDPAVKDRIIRVFVAELSIANKTAQIKCRATFEAFRDRLVLQSALKWTLPELIAYREGVQASVRDLEGLIAAESPPLLDSLAA